MAYFNQIHVVINPAAGKDEAILNTLNRVFSEYDVKWDVSITHTYGDGQQLARKAIENGADLVAAYGGDGTICDVANGMIGSGIPFFPLPGGTGNAYSMSLGIAQSLQRAAEQIFTGEVRQVDAGTCNGQYFTLRVDAGIATEIVGETNRELKDRFGALGYIMNTLRKLPEIQPTKFWLQIDNEEVELNAIACVIANAGEIGGGIKLSLGRSINPFDGLLDVFMIQNVVDIVASAAAHILRPDEGIGAQLQHWQAKSIRIETDPPHSVRGDGEPFGETPAQVDIVPAALKVLMPADRIEGDRDQQPED